MMRNVQKLPFTLIEICLVLFILSLGVILTAIKIVDFYQEQQFQSESQQFLSHLAMAQDLMLFTDNDVHFKIAPDEKSKELIIWLEVESPLEKAWARLLIERKITLKAIKSIEFNEKRYDELNLKFSLGKMSQGLLTLVDIKKDETRSEHTRNFNIRLSGYPCQLKEEMSKEEEDKEKKSELLYPEEVYEKIYKKNNQTVSDSDT